MFVQRGVVKSDQELELLNTNMASISTALNEMVISTPLNFYGNQSQAQELPFGFNANGSNYSRAVESKNLGLQVQSSVPFTNLEEFRHSYEKFYRTKSVQTLCPYSCADDGLAHFTQPPLREIQNNVYSQRRSSAPNMKHMALLCAAIDVHTSDETIGYPHVQRFNGYDSTNDGGARKKNIYAKTTKAIDYDSVVIDLSAIGLNTENREENEVLRLFNLFYKLNFYMNNQIPYETEETPIDYPCRFEKPQPLMPKTMNVQTQIKHIVFKSTNFCFRLLEKLDEFKFADHDKYFECNRSIFLLRKYIKQLEPFKLNEFEHRQGTFVHSFSSAQAKNLEILLTQVIARVRECNILVEVYKWSIKKNIVETGLPSIDILKKAIAIAGAIKTDSVAQFEAEEDENVPEAAAPQAVEDDDEHIGNDALLENVGNGGGFAAVNYLPAPLINRRGIRFIGL